MATFKGIYNTFRTNAFSVLFWAPLANWGFVIAGCNDLMKPPAYISEKMSSILAVYSFLFMRLALQIKPKNYLLFACHFTNSIVQSSLLLRKLHYNAKQKQQQGLQDVQDKQISNSTP